MSHPDSNHLSPLLDALLSALGRVWSGQATDEELEWLDMPALMQFIDWQGSHPPTDTSRTQPGRAIVVASFDLEAASLSEVARLRTSLLNQGTAMIDLDGQLSAAKLPLAAHDITQIPSAHDTSNGQMLTWLLNLATLIAGCPNIGAAVEASYGAFGQIGPTGAAAQGLIGGGSLASAGQLKLSELCADRLGRVAIQRLREALGPDRELIVHRQERPLISADQRRLWQPKMELEVCRGGQVRLPGSPPSAHADTMGPLNPGDVLTISCSPPPHGSVVALLQSGRHTTPIPPSAATHEGSDRRVWRADVGLSRGKRRVVLVAASCPDLDLSEVLDRLNKDYTTDPELILHELDLCARAQTHDERVAVHAGPWLAHVAQREISSEQLAHAEELAQQGRSDEAERTFHTLIEDAPDSYLAISAHYSLGKLLRKRARHEDCRRELCAARREALKADALSLAADATRELGRSYIDVGDRARGRGLIDQASQWHAEAGDVVGRAWDQLQRAVVCWLDDDFTQAKEIYEAIVTPARDAGDALLEACALQGAGQCNLLMGNLDQAEPQFRGALAGFIIADDARSEMGSRGDLGILNMFRKRPAVALGHFDAQLSLAARLGNPFRIAQSHLNRAVALLALKRPFEAISAVNDARPTIVGIPAAVAGCDQIEGKAWLTAKDPVRALERLERIPIEDRQLPQDLRWRAALDLGECYDALNRPDEAEATYLIGVEATETARGRMTPNDRQAYLDTKQPLWRAWFGHQVRRQAQGRTLLVAVDRARARSFMDLIQQGAKDGDGLALGAEQRQSTVAWWLQYVSVGSPDLSQGHSGSAPTGLRERHTAKPATALLATQHLDHGLLVLFSDPEGVIYHVIPEGKVEALAQACASLRASLDRRAPADDATRQLKWLGETLLSGVSARLRALPQDTNLILLPDGPLHGLPLHGLCFDGQPLIARFAVSYAPSVTALVHWMNSAPATTRGTAVFADPLGDLPSCRVEALELCRIWSCEAHLGANASWTSLRAEAPSARLLHIASHAQRPKRGAPACLFLADTPEPEHARPRVLPPGCVGVDDILSLELDCELVVLSACESGQGGVSDAGEGPQLLSWAFLSAGARAVVASLWPVADATTAALSRMLHLELAKGTSRALALARAQRGLREGAYEANPGLFEAGDPREWAAFTLTGDPRPLHGG